MEAAGDKIRSNSQGWEDARVIGERQVQSRGNSTSCPSRGRAKIENIDQDGRHETDYGPEDFE